MLEWIMVHNIIIRSYLNMKLDLTGQKFGRLTPLHATNERSSQGLILWECQCDCGNIVKLPGSYIKRGQVKSCGCIKSEMLTKRNIENGKTIVIGDKFGSLTVIKDLGFRLQSSRKKRERWSLCECECGNQIEVRNNNLNTGMTQSCGCIKSRGERIIADILRKNNINFSTQYSFSDLRTDKNGLLKFDFAIFKDNILFKLIEFDGRQHVFGPDGTWAESDSLEIIQYRDNLKNQYCLKNNINLLRIPYTDIGKISIEYMGLQELILI